MRASRISDQQNRPVGQCWNGLRMIFAMSMLEAGQVARLSECQEVVEAKKLTISLPRLSILELARRLGSAAGGAQAQEYVN